MASSAPYCDIQQSVECDNVDCSLPSGEENVSNCTAVHIGVYTVLWCSDAAAPGKLNSAPGRKRAAGADLVHKLAVG